MSRVGKNPIVLPQGVDVAVNEQAISVKGPLGTATMPVNPAVIVAKEGDKLVCRPVESAPNAGAMSGTVRALVANMVQGVTKGFERKLTLVGVGYRAQAQGDTLNLTLGFSHPVAHKMPAGVKCETPTQTEILIKGRELNPRPESQPRQRLRA